MMTLAAPWLIDFAAGEYLEDLTDRVANAPDLEWDDVAPYFRDFVASYDDKVQGVVIDGDHLMVYYRTDLLGEAGLEPPNTWDEYIDIASSSSMARTSTAMGRRTTARASRRLAPGSGRGCSTESSTPFLQTQGTSQGAFFGDGHGTRSSTTRA